MYDDNAVRVSSFRTMPGAPHNITKNRSHNMGPLSISCAVLNHFHCSSFESDISLAIFSCVTTFAFCLV